MSLQVRIVSQQPPGGRCTLYAGYAEVLQRHLNAHAELVFSAARDAHGDGYPSLWLNGAPIPPADGVILMPGDILTALAAHEVSAVELSGLVEALEAPLERMLEAAG